MARLVHALTLSHLSQLLGAAEAGAGRECARE